MASATGAIVVVNPATTIVTPTANAFRYVYCNNSKGFLGELEGVKSEPVFVGKINAGIAALTLDLDHYPSELSFGNLIRVDYPSGQTAGYWRFEGRKSVMAAQNSYVVTLTPISAELKEISFNANYTSDTTQPNTSLGSATFDVPVKAAIAKTLHLTAGNVQSDGTKYDYAYNNATGADTIDQAVKFGGSSWWWYIDANGVVSLANTSPYAHEWTIGVDASAGEWDDDILSLFNGQPVMGATGPNGTTSISALAVDTNPGNPYSTVNIGERTNQPYSDTSLVTQAAVNAMASSLLGYAERVTSTRKITLTHYSTRKPQPGDACYLVEPNTATTDPAKPGNLVKDGPYLITDVSEYGATQKYEVTISASMVVPVMAYNPQMTQQQAMLKLIQNPKIQPVSNNGQVGSIGNGVVGGGASGGALTATPAAPIGLATSTGLDNLAQLNNAYLAVSWSANSASDGVAYYVVEWRKSSDPDTASSYATHLVPSSTTNLRIPGLYQGLSYTVLVAAVNGAGVQSAWSLPVTTVTALDTTPPAVPINLVAYRTPRGAMVSWSPGVETNGGTAPDLQGYSVQVSVDGSGLGWQQVTPSGAYSLNTSLIYTAPTGTAEGTMLSFQVAAVDWSGNVSAYCSPSPAIYTDGVSFAELTVGNLNAYGLISATGGLSTRSTSPSGSASGPGVDINASGLTLYDGTNNNYGNGAGVTAQLNATNGSAFFSGTVQGSTIIGATVEGTAGASGGSGARMWLDFTDTTAGVGPLLDVNDGTVDRVQIGNLAASGTSPAMYGIRVNNSGGTPIFDSSGLLAGVATVLNTGSGGAISYPTQTTLGALTATNTTFTVSTRPQNILVIGTCTLAYTALAGNSSNDQASVGISGQGYGLAMIATHSPDANTNNPNNGAPLCSIYYQANVPVGSYTAQFQAAMTGFSGGMTNWQIIVLQLGA